MPAISRTNHYHSSFFIPYLVITALLCGALVMVIEVLGSRVLSPLFGVSLFVWTSLITVTLVSLAMGYAAGGVLSDRKNQTDYLYGIILICGVTTLLIPLVKAYVLKTCLSFGLRWGSLISSAILFGPSLFFLGCVSPYIIKLAAKEMKNIGRTVGFFYAISTVGSFLGTILTGFVLIAYFQVSRIFNVVGFVLICLAVIYFVLFKKQWLVMILFLFSPLFFYGSPQNPKILPNGTKVTEVFSTDSFYGNLKVLDYTFEDTHRRELLIDGFGQSFMDMKNRLSLYGYPYFIEFLPYALNPFGEKCLVIGLGAGIIPMWYEERGITCDVVDIDPKIADIAEKYFGFHITGDIIISDARYFLLNSERKYDYILVDVFTGDVTPGHILSLEAFTLLNEKLTAQGILALNLIGSLKRETFMTASVIRTLKKVFETVKVYPNASTESLEGILNLTVVAYNRPPMDINPEIAKGFRVHPAVRPLVSEFLGKEFVFAQNTPAIELSDDYNPIDFFDIWLKERIRKGYLEYTDVDMLL